METKRNSALVLIVILVLTFGVPALASAQLDYSAEANYGTVSLEGGFTPDPHEISVASGGSVNLATAGPTAGCTGFATSNPDLKLQWNDETPGFLRVSVESSGDTTLVINDSAGNWHCDDDSGGNSNPQVDLATAGSGRYDIWAGSYSANENLTSTLRITELGSGGALDYAAEANYGTVRLKGGFTPDPHEISVSSGGSVNLATAGPTAGCTGFATSNPDLKLQWDDETPGFLRVSVESSGDTTLVINDSAGNWYCDDDSGGNSNPQIDLATAGSGRYDIWVGSYSATETLTSVLRVSELQ